SLGDEATKVTTFLQRCGHNPDEACAIMGVALARLIDNRGMLESFINALRAEYRVVRGLVRLAAVLLTLSATPAAVTAQAAEPETLTLACKGTITEIVDSAKLSDDKPEPVSMGIVVNFANRTVQGFQPPRGNLLVEEYYPVKITGWDDVTVSFEGSGSVSFK